MSPQRIPYGPRDVPKMGNRTPEVPGFRDLAHSITDLRKRPTDPDTGWIYAMETTSTPAGLVDDLSPQLLNGITNTAGFVEISFCMDEIGWVKMRGVPNVPSATIFPVEVLVLPEGFRPAKTELFDVGVVRWQMDPDGTLTLVTLDITNGVGGTTSLDGGSP